MHTYMHTHTHTRTHTCCPSSFFYRLSKLDASHNALQHIPSGVFRLPELTNLSLSYNQLQTLPGDPECAMTYGMFKRLQLYCTTACIFDYFFNLYFIF